MITIDDYLAFRGMEPDILTAPAKTQLGFIISAAIAECERYCRRSFVAPATAIDEIFSGDGTKDYFVKNAQIETSSTPVLATWSGSAWVSSTASILFARTTGRIWFTDSSLFTLGSDNWRVTYKPGCTDETTVPLDLKLSVLRYVQALHLQAEGKEGISSESFDGKQTSYRKQALSDDILNTWHKHRSYGGN